MGIKHWTGAPHHPQTHGGIESFNKTIKSAISKTFLLNGDRKWVKWLPTLLSRYNHQYHSRIETRPIDVTPENQEEVRQRLLVRARKAHQLTKQRFKVGDRVRLKLLRTSAFEKRVGQNWTDEIFKVRRVMRPRNQLGQMRYQVEALDGEPISGELTNDDLLFVPSD